MKSAHYQALRFGHKDYEAERVLSQPSPPIFRGPNNINQNLRLLELIEAMMGVDRTITPVEGSALLVNQQTELSKRGHYVMPLRPLSTRARYLRHALLDAGS